MNENELKEKLYSAFEKLSPEKQKAFGIFLEFIVWTADNDKDLSDSDLQEIIKVSADAIKADDLLILRTYLEELKLKL